MSEDYRYIKFAKLDPDERLMVYGNSRVSLSKPEGVPGRRFLIEERHLDVETIANFKMGFVPFTVDHPFRGRIVMPIFDAYSKLLALSVRPATKDEAILDEFGKYWNESYEKGRHLYGLNVAKSSIIQLGFAILVEGQMDVSSMHSYGLTNTVGVLGGAFTPFQAMLLKRWTNNVVTLFDGDGAGKNHTTRCLDVLSHFKVKTWAPGKKAFLKACSATLPSDKDPNSFLIRYGSYQMRKLISETMQMANMPVPGGWLK